MKGICGSNCDECNLKEKCKGCIKTKGCPFGKKCFISSYIEIGGKESYDALKEELMMEFNCLKISGMPKVKELFPLNGKTVNLEYKLPNNKKVKLLDDNEIYLGNQVECIFNNDEMKSYFGIIANNYFLLISEYQENGINPEIIIYKRR